MADTAVLLPPEPDAASSSLGHSSGRIQSVDARSTGANVGNQWADTVPGLSCIRQALVHSGFSADTAAILMASWRDSTKAKYAVYIRRWLQFCAARGLHYLSGTVEDGLSFLTQVYTSGAGFSSVNAAKAAVSVIIPPSHGVPFGRLPVVVRFMRGISNLRPVLPKYPVIWPVSSLLNYYRSLGDTPSLDLRDLSLKTASLLCLVMLQRAQTIHSLDIKHIQFDESGVNIAFPTRLKQSRPSYHPMPVLIKRFSEATVCPVQTLDHYIQRTASIRGAHAQLFLSYVKPHNPISRKSIYRWFKSSLASAGIDVSVFQGHSLRAAGTSAAAAAGVPVNNILKAAGWSSELTFARHYHCPIMADVGAAVLSCT